MMFAQAQPRLTPSVCMCLSSGSTIFDWVNRPYSTESYSPFRRHQRDLWYCALRCEGIDTGQATEMYSKVARWEPNCYTPEHYRALTYLDIWDCDNFSQQVQESLKVHPWTEVDISESAHMRDEKKRKMQEVRVRWRDLMRERRRERKERNDSHVCTDSETTESDQSDY